MKSNKLLLIGGTITTIGWIVTVLVSIILSITFETQYIDNSPNEVAAVEAMSTELNFFTYALSYSANKTQSVTLELLTPNSRVWATEGDCIGTVRESLTVKNGKISLNSTVQRSEVAFYKNDTPLFALANSSLTYTITALSTDKTGCISFYFFSTRYDFEHFLQSNCSDIEGYYNKSINCTATDSKPHTEFFSINVTGETFVGVEANVSTNITYSVKGLIDRYNASNCIHAHSLTYKKPYKIDICKSLSCAFRSNKTTIVIDSEKQGVHIHWEPKPLELTLTVWIMIMIAGLLLLGIVTIVIVILSLVIYKFLSKRIKQKRNRRREQEGEHRGHNVRDQVGAGEQSKQRAEAAKITAILHSVLESCHPNMSTLFKEKLDEIAKTMHKEKLITHDLGGKLSYDAIIASFERTLKFMLNKDQLEKQCDKFISCIKNMKEDNDHEKWEKLADAIKKGWEHKSPGFKLERNLARNDSST